MKKTLSITMALAGCAAGSYPSITNPDVYTSDTGRVIIESEGRTDAPDPNQVEHMFDCIYPIESDVVTIHLASKDDTFYTLFHTDFLRPTWSREWVSDKVHAVTLRSTHAMAIAPGQPPTVKLLAHEYVHLTRLGDDAHQDPIWGTISDLATRCGG